MSDQSVADGTELDQSTAASSDLVYVVDVSAVPDDDGFMTLAELAGFMYRQNGIKFQFGEPSDGSVVAGTAIVYVDTTTSPRTLAVKTRSTDSPELVETWQLA